MKLQSLSTRLITLALATTVAFTAAACSGSEQSSSSSTSTTASAGSGSSTTAVEGSASSTTAAPGSSAGDVDCAAVQSALDTVAQISKQAISEGSSFDAQQFAPDVQAFQQQIGVLEQQATLAGVPASVLQTYTSTNNTLISLLQQLAQTGDVQTFQAGLQSNQTPEYTAASGQLAAALKAQCPSLTNPL